MRLPAGTVCEVRPGYSMTSGLREVYDAIAGCEAVVVRYSGEDVLVEVRGIGEVWVRHARLKRVGGEL